MWFFDGMWEWVRTRFADLADGSQWFTSELWHFIFGGAPHTQEFSGSTLTALKEIAFFSSILAAGMGCAAFFLFFVLWRFGKTTRGLGQNDEARPIPLWSIVVTAPIVEEFLFRVIPLVLLVKLFPGTIAFYVVLLLFNAIWALMHRWRWQKFWVLPMRARGVVRPRWSLVFIFADGLVFAYVLMKYGIFMSIVAHSIYNATLVAGGFFLFIVAVAIYCLIVLIWNVIRTLLRFIAN